MNGRAVKSRKSPGGRKTLRSRAEVLVQAGPAEAPPGTAESSRLLHERELHHAELEMQNDELRRIQSELEASRDHYVQLYHLAPIGYLTLDKTGRVQEANATAASVLGVDRADLLDQPVTQFIPPESKDVFYQYRERVFASASPQRSSLLLRKPGGEPFVAELESVVAEPQNGRGRQCLIALSDITARTKAEKSLELFRALLERSRDAVEVIDVGTGRFLDANARAAGDLGYTREEFLRLSVFDVNPNLDRATYEHNTAQLRDVGSMTFDGVHRRKDGTTFPVEVSLSLITLDRTYELAIVRDITGRKQAEGALRWSEEALGDFFAEAPLGLLWVSPDGHVERVNRTQLELLGLTQEAAMGARVADWFVKSELAADVLRRLAAREIVKDVRARLRRPNGALVHVLLDANALWRDGQYLHSRWFVRDITRRVELQREVLAIAARERQRLGHDLHDDLCQQLSGIQFLSETLAGLLQNVSESGTQRAREIGRLIRQSIDRARELAHGLSPVSLEHDGLMTALRGLAESTRRIFRRDCRFACEAPVLVPDHTVSANLYHIAQEAVSNAIRHGKARRIELSLSAPAGRTILAISDNGTGLPRRTRKRPGMGLRVMQYRAAAIGAILEINRVPAGGTEVVCIVGPGD